MRRVWGLLAGLALAASAGMTVAAEQVAPQRPRLVVAISIDQFSANLFEEYRPRFRAGLKRLSDGIAYPSGYQSHANTETCPGHSTILTGKRPNKTGIVGNNIPALPNGANYCLFDPDVTLPGSTGTKVSPKLMLATTLGDWLKAANPASKVVAISGKDRGAITMAGQNPNAVFWYGGAGGFTTYVKPGGDPALAMAPINAVNEAQAATRANPPAWDYAEPYCRTLELTWPTATSPRELKLPIARPNTNNSPLLDDFTLEGARSLIRSFNLGRGTATDLLAVSFSSTDYVGHAWGSRGAEMCEQMFRLDRTIGTLLSDLDGLNIPYAVVLTADHGASDFSERLAANGYPGAVRVNTGQVLGRVNQALMTQFNLPAAPLTGSMDEPVLAPSVPAAQRAAVLNAAVALFKQQPEIFDAFTLDEVLATTITPGTPPDEFTLKQRFAASAYRGRSGDLFAALKPLEYPGGALPMAGHGSPWNYDRRVPILFWWQGAPSVTRFLPIETVDIAPSLANLLGLTPPGDLDGRCLPLLPNGCPNR